MRDVMVYKISLNSALEFVAQCEYNDQQIVLGKHPQCFGVKDSNVLIAVAIFSNPMAQELQKRYTTEFVSIVASHDSQKAKIFEKFIKHYQNLPKSVDLFVSKESVEFENAHEVFQTCGMTPVMIYGETFHEWHNPKIQFYTYKITSILDDSYYYGRHQTSCTTIDEMINDGYMGSGGVKFQNWTKYVGNENLRKEILKVHETWGKVVKAEEELIGDKYKTDEKCKNSKPGGTGLASFLPEYTINFCPKHGLRKFRGGCQKCCTDQTRSHKHCPIHGWVPHMGNACYTCVSQKQFTYKECSIHGSTLFKGPKCCKCQYTKHNSLKTCDVHGITIHYGDTCVSCKNENAISLKTCPTHGSVKHIGKKCQTCINSKTIIDKECSKHGLTAFKGNTCVKCSVQKVWTTEVCVTHGKTKHRSGKCEKCTQQKRALESRNREMLQTCSKHGRTKFLDGRCKKCQSSKQISVQKCPIHGNTKFNGNACGKCIVSRVWTVEECSVHGETKHRSGKCERCARLKQWKKRRKESSD